MQGRSTETVNKNSTFERRRGKKIALECGCYNFMLYVDVMSVNASGIKEAN